MKRLALIPLLLIALAGCGESEQDKYIDDFKPLNDQLIDIGGDLAKAVQGADTQTDSALAKQFTGLADKLDKLRGDIAALDTPSDLKDEAKGLDDRLDDTVGDLKEIAKAADKGDAQAAAGATIKLGTDAEKVNAAQNKLAKATGAEVGDR